MYNELLKELVLKLKISEIELQEIISKVKEETGKTRVDTYDLCKKMNATELYYTVLERYARHTYTLKTKEIPEIFRKIKGAHKKIGVVSNSQERTIELFLKRFSLFSYVDFISSGDKKTILFWVTLERKFGIKKEDALVIDDSDEILDVAKHSGYKTLNVKNIKDISEFSV